MQSEIVTFNNKVLHLGLAKGQLAPNIILVGDPARAFLVAKRFERIDHEVQNREYVTITGVHDGLPVSVIGTGIGVDNVEIAVVEAYAVLAFDFDTQERVASPEHMNIIRVGTSAGVQEHVDPGTLAIADYALGLDNSGLFYDHPPADATVTAIEEAVYRILTETAEPEARFRGKIFPYASKASANISRALATSAAAFGQPYVSGITASTSGFYGPSSRVIVGLRNTIEQIKPKLADIDIDGQRVVNMEMESSLLFHVAAHLGSSVGTICPVISKPTGATDIFDYRASVEDAISISLAALISVNKPT